MFHSYRACYMAAVRYDAAHPSVIPIVGERPSHLPESLKRHMELLIGYFSPAFVLVSPEVFVCKANLP